MSAAQMPSHILVTGGAGFIGSEVVRQLRQHYPDASLRVLHLPAESLLNLAGIEGIELMPGDITSASDMAKAVAGCDVVFHLAAIYAFWLPDMSLMQRVNVGGTRCVLEACKAEGVSRVVYTSSAVRFSGHGEQACTESSSFAMGASPYAVSKYRSHKIAESFARDGLDVVIVNPAMPMGPGDIGPTPTGRLLVDIFRYPIPFAARSTINIIDVRDCAYGHLLAYEKGRRGESYLLAGDNYTYKDMLAIALDLCHIKRPIVSASNAAVRPIARALELVAKVTKKPPLLTLAEVELADQCLVCDASKARAELGLRTRPLRETLADALSWFVAHGYITDKRAVKRFG